MRTKMIQQVKFRRRRDGVTNYKKRLALVKSGLSRVVIRKSNKSIIAQIIKYAETGDKVVASADSNELAKKYNWPSRRNKPTAYLTGLLLAKKSKDKDECILDIGITTPVKMSIPFVFARGCVDGGLKLRGKFEVKEEEYNSSLISKYAVLLKKDEKQMKRQFGGYLEKGINPENLPTLFSEVKEKILKGN